MGLFTYDVNEPHDKPEQIVEAARKILTPDIQRSHEESAAIRQFLWDTRRFSSHGTYQGGNSEYQWLAHIPRRIAELLDFRHPGWDTDEELFARVIKEYPECRISEDLNRRG